MEKYIFTRRGYEALIKLIKKIEGILKQTIKAKAEAGSGQDGWHDEGFKIGVSEEMMWSQRLGELEELCRNAEVIEPIEQNEFVNLGTGVILKYENGETSKFILEGYNVEGFEGRLSIHSPLGQAIWGAKKGERRYLRIGKNEKMVTIQEILPPSKAEGLIANCEQ